MYRRAPCPDGTPWEGQTADAAIQRVGTDRVKALGAVDMLHTAATVARSGVSELQTVRQLALQAVAEAQAAGFTVGDDLSVIDRVSAGTPALHAARRNQARVLAARIGGRAAALVAVEPPAWNGWQMEVSRERGQVGRIRIVRK